MCDRKPRRENRYCEWKDDRRESGRRVLNVSNVGLGILHLFFSTSHKFFCLHSTSLHYYSL